ncbi:hypothetical protein CLAIMM_12418 [Cladophialophora immunda]|nr:hypothetical protein CLAIMM_12418 [Cladophialophora immunda]
MTMDMMNALLYSLLGLVCLASLYVLRTAYRQGIRNVPGPWAAKFSILYRLSLILKGKAPEEYGKLHEKYGHIVRVGPFHVSINDPAAIPQIYGISSRFGKSEFYSVSPPYYDGKQLENMFTTRNLQEHRQLRSATTSVYSMTNLRNYEPHVDECTEIFLGILKKYDGQAIDITEYMHFYALDVIAAITFQKRLGYLDHQQDVLGLVASRGFSAKYFGIVGQIPWIHRYLLGNRRLVKWLARLYPDTPDPHGTLFAVIEKQIEQYDLEKRLSDRTDFLQQLRRKDDPDRANHKRDLMNHLSNNVTAGGDTIAIALRAMLYYLARTPAAYKSLVQEIVNADANGALSPLITFEESLKLKYL